MYVHVDVCVGMCISDSPGILCTLTSWHCEYTCMCMCLIERVRMMDVAKQSKTAVFPVRCLFVWTVTGNVNCLSISALVSCEVCVCVCARTLTWLLMNVHLYVSD